MLRFVEFFTEISHAKEILDSFLRGKEEFLLFKYFIGCLCVYYKQYLYVIILTNFSNCSFFQRKSGYNSYLSMLVNQRLVFSWDTCPSVNEYLNIQRQQHRLLLLLTMHFQLAAVLCYSLPPIFLFFQPTYLKSFFFPVAGELCSVPHVFI